MPIKLEREWSVPDADRKTTDRADYTQDVITNVDVTVQTERLAAITKSSSDPIQSGIGNAYNTDWIVTGDFNKLIGFMRANANCTIYLEESLDGEAIDPDTQTTQAYTADATDGRFSFEITAPYVRLRIVAATNTTVFRVWSRLSSGA